MGQIPSIGEGGVCIFSGTPQCVSLFIKEIPVVGEIVNL